MKRLAPLYNWHAAGCTQPTGYAPYPELLKRHGSADLSFRRHIDLG